MALKLSPDYLVVKYLKSATNGKSISIRLIRVVTLILIALLITGTIVTVNGYLKAKQAAKEYNQNKFGLMVLNATYKNDNGKWDYQRDEYLGAMMRAKRNMNWYEFPIYFFLTCFIIPWICIRLSFWIIDAGMGKQ